MLGSRLDRYDAVSSTLPAVRFRIAGRTATLPLSLDQAPSKLRRLSGLLVAALSSSLCTEMVRRVRQIPLFPKYQSARGSSRTSQHSCRPPWGSRESEGQARNSWNLHCPACRQYRPRALPVPDRPHHLAWTAETVGPHRGDQRVRKLRRATGASSSCQ